MVDCVYIAASARDARFTRICVASVRRFYADIPIRLLQGGSLQSGLADELSRFWKVELAKYPMGNYGWGFVKLEPLFGESGERFLTLDSDTLLAKPALELSDKYDEDFIVDNEDQSSERAKEIYFDADLVPKEGLALPRCPFYFNTGQWFGRSGILKREDFGELIDWDMPRSLSKPRIFKNGEQGVLNFIVNWKSEKGEASVARVPLMHWPGHESSETGAAESLSKPIIHWAGFKSGRFQTLPRSEDLMRLERHYYSSIPGGSRLRATRALSHMLRFQALILLTKARQNQWRLSR